MHEDKVVFGGDCQNLGPQVRRRLTPISDDFFQPLHPRFVWMHRRMITVVISEILTGNIDVASHNFLESVLKEPLGKRLVSSTDIGNPPLLGNDGEIWGSWPRYTECTHTNTLNPGDASETGAPLRADKSGGVIARILHGPR